MEKFEDIFALLFCIMATLLFGKEIKEKISEIKKIKMNIITDKKIEGEVVGAISERHGDIRPRVRYYVDNQPKIYTFHSPQFAWCYPKGKKVKLKLSSKSKQAYIWKDMRKALIIQVFFFVVFFSFIFVLL